MLHSSHLNHENRMETVIISVTLGLNFEYGVRSRTSSLSTWRPRLLPDPNEKEAVLLETFSVREADIMVFILAHYQIVSVLVQC